MTARWGLIVAGALALAGSSAQAAGNEDVSFTGARVRIGASAVVSLRALARAERTSPMREQAEPEEAPEPEEKAEPNVHFTVPSPLVSPLSATSSSALPRRTSRGASSGNPTPRRSAQRRLRRRPTRTVPSAATR